MINRIIISIIIEPQLQKSMSRISPAISLLFLAYCMQAMIFSTPFGYDTNQFGPSYLNQNTFNGFSNFNDLSSFGNPYTYPGNQGQSQFPSNNFGQSVTNQQPQFPSSNFGQFPSNDFGQPVINQQPQSTSSSYGFETGISSNLGTFQGLNSLGGSIDKINNIFSSFSNTLGQPQTQNQPTNPSPANNPIASVKALGSIKRKLNGRGNNQNRRNLGSALSALVRKGNANYADGRQEPISNLPGPREISNIIGAQTDRITPSSLGLSMVFTIFSQFLDHDISLTEADKKQSLPIKIPQNDQFFTPGQLIRFFRSKTLPSRGVRTFPNEITTWIDGSQIYGSSKQVGDKLRSFNNGKLRTSNGQLLLKNGQLFEAGDVRVNENVLLTIFHTVFMREHNRLCDQFRRANSSLTDQELYQSAKNYVAGLLQRIVFEEYLPLLVGSDFFNRNIGQYQGYNPNTDPTLSIEFTTAIFRVGHSLLVNEIPQINSNGVSGRTFRLKQLFFNPDLLNPSTVENLMRGLLNTQAKDRNNVIVDGVRNFLIDARDNRNQFFDLFSLNVQRGRDHGIPSYNAMRKAIGLRTFYDFSYIQDRNLAYNLQGLYGSPDRMDLWVGIITEPKIRGSLLGELGRTILVQEFRKIRQGDRFWYENQYPADIINEIKSTSLSDIIKRNIPNLGNIQSIAFKTW